MDIPTMRRAIGLESEARALLKQYETYVLLQPDSYMKKETINVGDPVTYKTNQYHRIEVEIPTKARRYVFNLWRKEIALKYNTKVRELNQIGALTDLRLIPIQEPHP